jgi:hypothetical protein
MLTLISTHVSDVFFLLFIIGTAIYSIWRVRKEQGVVIHAMWLGFSTMLVLTFAFAYLANKYGWIYGKGQFAEDHAKTILRISETMYDFIGEGWLIVGVFACLCVIQILAYILAGLSGSAGNVVIAPYFNFGFYVFLKSYIAAGGFWLGLYINGLFYGWFSHKTENVFMMPFLAVALVASSFSMLYAYEKSLKDIGTILIGLVGPDTSVGVFLAERHEWMTRSRN